MANSGSSGRYKERYRKGPDVSVGQDVRTYSYKRILDQEARQPSKYMRQTKPRDRSYRPKSSALAVGLKSMKEPESDLPLSESIHTDDAVSSFESESEEDCFSMEKHVDDVAFDERMREEEYDDDDCESAEEAHAFQDRESKDMEDNTGSGDRESESYKYLYEGCPIREDHSIVLISLYASRHHLTDVAVSDLLKLIALHCPTPNNCTKSLFRYHRIRNKQLSDNLDQEVKFVCSSCGQESSSKSCLNETCSKYQKPSFKPCQLITLPIFPQLKRIVLENIQQLSQNPNSSDSSKITDTTDGRRYKEIKSSAGDYMISLTINADGAPVFKSSKTSAWPLMCAVAELPPTARFNVDNMVLAAVWCGRSKPAMNLFVKAFVDEVLHLSDEGIRANIHHEVYHGSASRRKGNTCSSIVEVIANNSSIYGRIVKFILHQSQAIVVIKIFHTHNLNICKETPRSTRTFLRKLSEDDQLASFYLPVEELEELIAVDCTTIRRKCIIIEDEDFHEAVAGFLIPVLRDYRV